MGNKFTGFGTMAVAMAAAGLGMPAPAVAAALAAPKLKFILLSRDGWRVWVQDVGGGECRSRLSTFSYPILNRNYNVVIEEIYADSWEAIPMEERKKQSAWVEGGDAGWLDREGNFYSCNYGGHSRLSTEVLFRDYAELEKAGWVHVDDAPDPGHYTFRFVGGERTLSGMSPQQIAWLKQRGHDLNPHGKPAEEEVLKLGDYTINAAADKAAFERELAKAGLDPKKYQKKSGVAAFRDEW